jgi:hypothetical protein
MSPFCFIGFLGLITLSQTQIAASEGTARSYVLRGPPECRAVDKCTQGEPCFLGIFIEGEPARILYDAMKHHAPKVDEFSGSNYFGTSTDAMVCYEINGNYSCRIGYDAGPNVLTKIEIDECEFNWSIGN